MKKILIADILIAMLLLQKVKIFRTDGIIFEVQNMSYTTDFTLKCNKNNCNGIAVAYLAASTASNYPDHGNILVKCYNEKKKQRYVIVVDMSFVADKYNIKDKYIYCKMEDYERYSKKRLINLYKDWQCFIRPYLINRFAKEHGLIIPCASAPHTITYTDIKKRKTETVYCSYSDHTYMEV